MSGAGLSMIALAEELEKINYKVIMVVRRGHTESILSKMNIRHYVINAQPWTEPINRSRMKNWIVRVAKKALNVFAYIKMTRLLLKEKPDIVHINTSTTYVAAKVAAKHGVKIVWHFRELLEEDFNSKLWNQQKSEELFNQADHIITISRCVYQKYRPLLSSDMSIVYNGIDINRYFDSNHDIFENKKIVVTIAGRINKTKGQLTAIKGMSKFLHIGNNIEFWIVGNGEESEINKIKEYAKEKCLCEESIKFLGYIDDMEKIWAKTDIAIVASKYEAFGRVTVEAMAAGCIVVGANSGGTKELLEDGRGVLFTPEDPIDLELKIEHILSHKTEFALKAKKARDYAATVFTSKKNAAAIAEIYNTILFEHRSE